MSDHHSITDEILDVMAFAVASYDQSGTLLKANKAFRSLMSGLGLECRTLHDLLTVLGLPLAPTDFCDYIAPSGLIAAVAVAGLPSGGWVVSAKDMTEQRRASWEAKRAQKVALIALADLAEHRDNDTGEHFQRVARMTYEVARQLKADHHYAEILTDEFLAHIGVASILHDVGKVATSDAILRKTGLLTAEEHRIMQSHAVNAGILLRKADALLAGSIHFRLAAEIAEFHHERLDGSGYPHGLRGDAIPVSARIVAVTDVFDALTSERSYKIAWETNEALTYLREKAGIAFDAVVVDSLIKVLDMRSRANMVVWTPDMSVGVESLDQDHRMLIALVNQIALPENKSDPLAVEFVLDELLGYTAFHFEREEKMIGRVDYPDFIRHRNIHRSMINSVRDLQRRCLSAFTPALGDELHHFLGDWLTSHILKEDQAYVPFLTPGK